MTAPSQKFWLVGLVLSAGLHTLSYHYITSKKTLEIKSPDVVKVRINEVKPEPPKEQKPAAPLPPKPAEVQKPKIKPKPKVEKKITTERTPVEKPVPDAKPIQGLSKNSMDPNGKGVAVPVGNTLMTEDRGERVKDAAPMAAKDMSADARMIRESMETPQYTDAAIDANFEGVVLVDVFVDEKGDVTEAELRKKVGFGMDERILSAARKTHFIPRKNKLGGPEAGWTEIRFTLQIP